MTEVILEALDRAGALTLRGIRGIIGEATFVREVVPSLTGWEAVTPPGDLPYDAAFKDDVSTIKVQVKMQRRAAGVAWLRNGAAVVEVQRTRGGKRDGEDTRPYRFWRIRHSGRLHGTGARALEFIPLHPGTVAESSAEQ